MTRPTDENCKSLPFGIRTPAQLTERIKVIGSTEYIIGSLIPRRALTLFVGDSGLGKSPFLYQAAVCVAAGLPFLGRPVQRGKVLYMDCENGLAEVRSIVSQVTKFLGLASPPEDLLLWNLNDCDEGFSVEKLVESAKPDLVIIDPINAIFHEIERDSRAVTQAYQSLRKLNATHGCSTAGVHHLRKPGEFPLCLETANVREWFLQARGPRALINNCDVRLGLDLPAFPADDSKLVFRGFGRVTGEIPLIRLERDTDGDGDPQGYRQLCGVELLNNPEQQAAYQRLPAHFKFGDAKTTYGKADQATSDFLKNCIAAGILRKLPSKEGYEKIEVKGPVRAGGVPNRESEAA